MPLPEVRLVLRLLGSDLAVVSVEIQVDMAGGKTILEIGGNPGDLAFLSMVTGSPEGAEPVQSAYTTPEGAPDRLAGYTGMSMVVLANGSERLSDAAVKALRLYVLDGGLIAIPGGVAPPMLSDGRWQGLIPVRPLGPHVISGDSALRNFAKTNDGKTVALGAGVGAPYSVIDFQPLPGTEVLKEGRDNLIATRTFGLGRTVFWGFDPFHGALRDWPGRTAFFRRSTDRPIPNHRASIDLQNMAFGGAGSGPTMYSGGGSVYYTRIGGIGGGSGPYTRSHYGGPGMPFGEDPSNPFQVQMPGIGSISLILGLYFLCVIPINFLVLRKLNRREWAWTTSTIFSFVFAGVMLAQARHLYGISTSTSNQTVVVAQQGEPTAVARGHAQMFFSSSGVYNLNLSGVDSVAPATNPYDYTGGAQTKGLEVFSPVDAGQVRMSQVEAGNLQLAEFQYVQTLSGDAAHIERAGKDYVVTAKTTLNNAALLTAWGMYSIGDLAAGSTTRTSIKTLTRDHVTDPYSSPAGFEPQSFGSAGGVSSAIQAAEPWVQEGECALVANAPDLPVGPEVGKRIQPDPVLIMFARTGP